MPEESGKFSNSLPLAGTPSYPRGRVFCFFIPPLNLEEVAFMPGSLKYFVVFFQLPPSLCSSSLLSKRDSFLVFFYSSSKFRGGGIYAGGV